MSTAYEIARISVQDGSIQDFRDGVAKGAAVIARQPGCSGVEVLQCMEEPGQFLLRAAWDDLDAHMAFRGSEDFGLYRATVAHTFQEAPSFQHYSVVLSV